MVKQLFPRLPEAARPLDLFDAPGPDYPKIFHLRVKREWDEWSLVAVFNYEDRPLDCPIDMSRLGLDGDREYRVWEHWGAKSIGSRRRRFVAEVPPQSVKLYRVAQAREHPWLLSTDLHVRQGQAELEDCRWDADRKELTIRARRPPGHHGNAYVVVPPGQALQNPKGLWIAKDARDGSLVVRCSFEFRDSSAVEVRLQFQ